MGVSNFQEKSITKVHVSPLFVLQGDEWGPWGVSNFQEKSITKVHFSPLFVLRGDEWGGGVKFPGKKHYEGALFTVICVTSG